MDVAVGGTRVGVGGLGVAVGIGGLGVAVGGTGVLVGSIGVAVGGTGVGVACTGFDVGVACAGAAVRVQAVAARMIPSATSKSPSLFPFINKTSFSCGGQVAKAPPANTTGCVVPLTINLCNVQELKLASLVMVGG